MRLYVSGPISGIPDGNRNEFARVSEMLREAGHSVLNPHEVPGTGDLAKGSGEITVEQLWAECMWLDLAAVASFRPHGIVLLQGWMASRGARVEYNLLNGMGCRVFEIFRSNIIMENVPSPIPGRATLSRAWIWNPAQKEIRPQWDDTGVVLPWADRLDGPWPGDRSDGPGRPGSVPGPLR